MAGQVNSSNASTIESQIFDEVKDKIIDKLVLDFEEVTYISSAGLRVVLKLKQKYKDFSIINVSLDVYDVFQMTGFSDIMDIKKALNKIDVTNAEIIGEGYCSTVFRIDKDTIVKVFKNSNDIYDIKRELNLAKQAFVLGIPTAISFDVVKVGEKIGVRFEMLDCASLRDIYRDYPERFDELTDKYVQLLKTINTTVDAGHKLPDIRKKWIRKVELLKEHFTNEQYEKLINLVSSVEERATYIHGDCHVKNIMVQNDDLLLIDMDTLSTGHPIFELASIYAPYIAFEEDDPGNSQRFLGISSELSTKIFDEIVKRYVDSSNSTKDKIAIVSYIHMLWWNVCNEPSNTVRFNGCKARLLKLLEEYDDINIGL